MSHSKEQRLANVHLALKSIKQLMGQEFVSKYAFDSTKIEGIFPTTWTDMRDHYGYVENVTGFTHLYRLKASGWVEALRVEGVVGTPEFKKELGQLCRYMKDRVKGRSEDVTLNVQDIAAATGIPTGTISTIIEAKLIESEMGRYGAKLVKEFNGGLVVIPANFGLELP